MAYASVRGRRPIERASKISHAEIINNAQVQAFLEQCTLPEPADASLISSLAVPVEQPKSHRIRAVVAIDGGYQEIPVREQFPAATITFFTFGPLLLNLDDLAELDASPFLAPEDMARLKRIQRFSLVLPTRNISITGKSLQRSVRDTLHQFFETSQGDDPPFSDALRWLLFRGWNPRQENIWVLSHCPNLGCDHHEIVLTSDLSSETTCPSCHGPIYLIDSLRLHERIDEAQGAGGITSYVMTTLEQIALLHVVKAIWDIRPSMLSELLFMKDGPLAFFGQTSPLCVPMRELAVYLKELAGKDGEQGGSSRSLFNVVGLEKSGAFVDHAIQIEDRLPIGTALPLSNDYIYRYIIPGDPQNPDPYGRNTYWGSKLIYKARDKSVYVASIPTGTFTPNPSLNDYMNANEILSVVSSLRCSMYDNALVPIALANRLVSLSDFPSARILESFAKNQIRSSP